METSKSVTSYFDDIKKAEGDIRIVCSDGTITAHGFLLGARSPVMKRMLDGSFKEGIEKTINCPDDRAAIMGMIVDYFQLAKLPAADISVIDAADLYRTSDKYQIDMLKDAAMEILDGCRSKYEYLMQVIDVCRDEQFNDLRQRLMRTVGAHIIGGYSYRIKCAKCKMIKHHLVKCFQCEKNIFVHRGSNMRCINGHVTNLENLRCRNFRNINQLIDLPPCDGAIVIEDKSIEVDGISESTLAEVARMLLKTQKQ